MRIGAVRTGSSGAAPMLSPLPARTGEDARALLFDALEETVAAAPPPPPRPAPVALDDLFRRPARVEGVAADPAPPPVAEEEVDGIVDAVLGEIVADEDAASRSSTILYGDFTVRCRMRGLSSAPLTLQAFARALTLARLGISERDDPALAPALAMAERLPDDLLGVFMLIAQAAKHGAACPSNEEIARIYGTQSLGRVRRLLTYMEAQGFIVAREDFRKRRSITVPELGWTTGAEGAAGEPELGAASA